MKAKTEANEQATMSKQDRAREAMLRRSKKVDNKKASYDFVIYGFIAICVGAVLFTLFSKKQKFSEMQVIDEAQMLVHNGQGHQFKHGYNEFFKDKTIADVKYIFASGLSDTNQINPCKTSTNLGPEMQEEEMSIELPDTYDWREAFPQCVQPPADIGAEKNCSSTYAFATLSAVQDRICMGSNQTVKLSAQELITCDASQYGCEGGYANKVLNWGRKKGFISEECMSYKGLKAGECDVDHFETNECRVDNQIYKLSDICISIQEENIKREIFKYGPVVSQMLPFTDFLAYKEGSYHRTSESFKFNGYHLLKLVGWSQAMDGSTEWIAENSWGADWGMGGYVRILGGRGDVGVDAYALGMQVIPYTVYDYMSMQNMMSSAQDMQYGQDQEYDDNEPMQIDRIEFGEGGYDSSDAQQTLDKLTGADEEEDEESAEL